MINYHLTKGDSLKTIRLEVDEGLTDISSNSWTCEAVIQDSDGNEVLRKLAGKELNNPLKNTAFTVSFSAEEIDELEPGKYSIHFLVQNSADGFQTIITRTMKLLDRKGHISSSVSTVSKAFGENPLAIRDGFGIPKGNRCCTPEPLSISDEYIKSLIHEYFKLSGVVTKAELNAYLKNAGSTLKSALTATKDVGGITIGKAYAKGTSLETILRDLISPAAAQVPSFTEPSLSVSANKTSFDKGAAETLVITANFNRGKINPAYGTSGFRAGEAISYSLNGGAAQPSNVFEIDASTLTDNTTFIVKVIYGEGEQPKDSFGEAYDSPLPSGELTASVNITIIKPAVQNPSLTNPSATISANKTLFEAGSDETLVITANFNRGKINPAYGTSGLRSGEATGYKLNNGSSQPSNTFELPVSTLTETTFKVTVEYGAGEQPKNNLGEDYSSALPAGSLESNTISIELVPAMWANTTTIEQVDKLGVLSRSVGTYTFDFPPQLETAPEIFDVPADWEITAVETWNPLTQSWASVRGDFDVSDVDHNGIAYKRYRDNRECDAGARQIKITWR